MNIEKSWRCFHCDQVMTTIEEAELHFGVNETIDPACTIDIKRFREMELDYHRHAMEDSDMDRKFHAMQSDHGTALIREEEKGYAKGLKDGRAGTVQELRDALTNVKDAIERADPAVLTDVLWMPDDICMGATVVDFIQLTLDGSPR